MRIMKFSILSIALLSLPALALDGDQRTDVSKAPRVSAKASSETTSAELAPVRAKVHAAPGEGGPGNLTTKPGTVLTLCCGSVDPHEMTGSNCAYMHTGQGCAGMILACPEGSKDTVTKDGSGYCKTSDG